MPAIHHLHKRKRIHQKHEPYPHPDKFKRFIDRLAYAAGIATPIISLPQLWKIWVYKNAMGVSLLTWIFYLIIAIIFSIYGTIHKEKPLIIMYISLAIVEVFIIIGAVIYG